MSTLNSEPSAEYRGPGRLTAALGKGWLGLVIGGAGAQLGMIAGAAVGLSQSYKSVPVAAIVGALPGIAYIPYSFVKGWNNASNAKHDHDQLVTENAELKQKLKWVERVAQSDDPVKESGRS